MSATNTIPQLNRDLADQVLADAKQNPKGYPGKYVGIANGKVVVVTDDLDEMVRRLEEAEPVAANTFWVDLSCDYSKVVEIWRVG